VDFRLPLGQHSGQHFANFVAREFERTHDARSGRVYEPRPPRLDTATCKEVALPDFPITHVPASVVASQRTEGLMGMMLGVGFGLTESH